MKNLINAPPKHVRIVKFDNKAVKTIRLSQYFNHLEITSLLQTDPQNMENNLVDTYKLSGTVRSKIKL